MIFIAFLYYIPHEDFFAKKSVYIIWLMYLKIEKQSQIVGVRYQTKHILRQSIRYIKYITS